MTAITVTRRDGRDSTDVRYPPLWSEALTGRLVVNVVQISHSAREVVVPGVAARRRHLDGGMPYRLEKARLKAASES